MIFIVKIVLMLFGERLLMARKGRKVSQEELGKRLGIHAPIVGRYERNEVKPSIEVAAKIAEALEVSLDYLAGITDRELDAKAVKLVHELQVLTPDDRSHILKTVAALVREAKTRAAFG